MAVLSHVACIQLLCILLKVFLLLVLPQAWKLIQQILYDVSGSLETLDLQWFGRIQESFDSSYLALPVYIAHGL